MNNNDTLFTVKNSDFIDFEAILFSDNIEVVAEKLLEGAYERDDIMKRGVLDRFLDFVNMRVQFGYADIPSMVYPTKRMMNLELEQIIIQLINIHLYPEIVFPLLKFFTRNINNSDSNLYLANLLNSEEIIKSLFNTFQMFTKDIFLKTAEERTLNVKKIQQFAHKSDDKFSSPLDAAARFKYILEFLNFKNNLDDLFSLEDLKLSNVEK